MDQLKSFECQEGRVDLMQQLLMPHREGQGSGAGTTHRAPVLRGGDGKSAPPSLGHHSGARETGFWVSMSGSRTEKEQVLETSQEKNL